MLHLSGAVKAKLEIFTITCSFAKKIIEHHYIIQKSITPFQKPRIFLLNQAWHPNGNFLPFRR